MLHRTAPKLSCGARNRAQTLSPPRERVAAKRPGEGARFMRPIIIWQNGRTIVSNRVWVIGAAALAALFMQGPPPPVQAEGELSYETFKAEVEPMLWSTASGHRAGGQRLGMFVAVCCHRRDRPARTIREARQAADASPCRVAGLRCEGPPGLAALSDARAGTSGRTR